MTNVLVITKGHPFEREPFFEMFDAFADITWTHVEHPAALAVFEPEYASEFDALVFYDMPGVEFHSHEPAFPEPPQRLRENFASLTHNGIGLVFLHHAIAGWPAWPEYGELIGGGFLYVPQELRGAARQDSGYRHGVTHTVSVVADHPVTAGLPD